MASIRTNSILADGDFNPKDSVHAPIKCFTILDFVLDSRHGTTRNRFSPVLSLV